MEAEKVRSIRLPESVWNALDEDAARCRRSSQKQIEALLVTFYEMEDTEIDQHRLEMVGELMPRSGRTLPMLEATVEIPKKKRTA